MKINFLFLTLLFFNIYSRANSIQKKDIQEDRKIFLVGGGLTLTLAASYLYIENSWWSEKQTKFHFDNGSDKVYALNVDKAGHFLGGMHVANLFSESMLWAGLKPKNALLGGAIFGTSIQLAIELKDAYAPYWGFSTWDLAIGSFGSFLPVAQFYSPTINAFDMKISYWKKHNTYWDLERERGKFPSNYNWYDDYVNQTYWLCIDLNYFKKNIPDWINISIGFGLDETQYLNENNTKVGGNNEWYIALDYDIPKIMKRWNTPIAKKIKKWLNYFHFPSPTIRISPEIEFYPLFL